MAPRRRPPAQQGSAGGAACRRPGGRATAAGVPPPTSSSADQAMRPGAGGTPASCPAPGRSTKQQTTGASMCCWRWEGCSSARQRQRIVGPGQTEPRAGEGRAKAASAKRRRQWRRPGSPPSSRGQGAPILGNAPGGRSATAPAPASNFQLPAQAGAERGRRARRDPGPLAPRPGPGHQGDCAWLRLSAARAEAEDARHKRGPPRIRQGRVRRGTLPAVQGGSAAAGWGQVGLPAMGIEQDQRPGQPRRSAPPQSPLESLLNSSADGGSSHQGHGVDAEVAAGQIRLRAAGLHPSGFSAPPTGLALQAGGLARSIQQWPSASCSSSFETVAVGPRVLKLQARPAGSFGRPRPALQPAGRPCVAHQNLFQAIFRYVSSVYCVYIMCLLLPPEVDSLLGAGRALVTLEILAKNSRILSPEPLGGEGPLPPTRTSL